MSHRFETEDHESTCSDCQKSTADWCQVCEACGRCGRDTACSAARPAASQAAPTAAFQDQQRKVHRLMSAAKEGDVAELRATLADLSVSEELTAAEIVGGFRDGNRRGPYHFAAAFGRDEVLAFLLAEHPEPRDAADAHGWTPLALATQGGRLSAVALLLEAGADPGAVNDTLSTPLHLAAAANRAEVLALLLERGAPVDAGAGRGNGTALGAAAGEGHAHLVQLLLDAGADVDAASAQGATPLLMAVVAGSIACASKLVAAGALLSPTVAGGATALHVAADVEDNAPMVRALLASPHAAAALLIEATDGLRPVHYAANKGSREVVELLLAAAPSSGAASADQLIAEAAAHGGDEHAVVVPDAAVDLAAGGPARPPPVPEDQTPESVAAAHELKQRGNEELAQGRFQAALDLYSEAIRLNPAEATFFSNRSAAHVGLERFEAALADGQCARFLRPDWAKACLREGIALEGLGRFEEAACAFWDGYKLEPTSPSLQARFKRAIERGRAAHLASRAS